ncbi:MULTISPECIES: glycoside hydrolase family 15 protein [Sphingobium]|uniref:glycoside hydrolase family 15 protein n=1 Tax=Sphingobium TaxID=165695 RepID=UPI0015EC9F73|nr:MULTISPECIES: glycoside hydrolase family 15 protein [Sphingobium]MCW2362771.1 GH15 family glucan-1,4-alpha-glucosidase [Sphingobium sp. B10D3B]MCW2400548.1 GH15 family glucan-1,4-alpha-glucosidase [Sphingobium sp. B10D7B]MCW2407527.1 GH15 family glucan-1,4-alpha-glucosidase [Sphingobium xanthum]
MTATLDLWPIGNCQVSALIDRAGRFVWGCVPRVDGDPAFSSLLDPAPRAAEGARGFWEIDLEDCVETAQHYVRNTPVLVTRHEDKHGNAIEVIDFCPRFHRSGRMFRPVAYARIVKPVAGSPRIRIRLRPARDWGARDPHRTRGTNHIRYMLSDMTLRLTTTAPVGWIEDERLFRVERPLHFFLGPDESFADDLRITLDTMLDRTIREWQGWVRGLATPVEWQKAVIRAAITLKLCQHEETGAIVAALTTSLPEHADSGRNWDYRYCWIRDAYYTVQALNRLGALDVLESYLEYLRNLVDNARGGHIQPLYGVGGEATLTEWIAPGLAGYRGMGPVRVGNQAAEQIQHDAYGQIVLSSTQSFFDRRLLRMGGTDDFHALEAVGERAWDVYDKPDAGLWELRTRSHVHTYSAAMCWAACDRLANAAAALDLPERAAFWQGRADSMRQTIIDAAWREDTGRMSATFGGDDLDASIIQLLDLRFLSPGDPRFKTTLEAVEQGLRRGSHMLRYATEDDFGLPSTAFNVCTFWLIEALHATGRVDEARVLFEEMLSRRTAAGLLSEDIDPATGELWGNYPQTYSLVGLINCAVLLSKPWSTIR